MKNTELRIGNWFIEFKEPIQFDGDFYHLCGMKPIPLTEEWLLKFGFIYNRIELGLDQFRKGVLELSITHNGFEIFFTYKWIEIKYVHQLQNLYFALTGEELEIKKPTK